MRNLTAAALAAALLLTTACAGSETAVPTADIDPVATSAPVTAEPEPTPEPEPDPTPEPEPEPDPTSEADPTPEPSTEPEPTAEPSPTPEPGIEAVYTQIDFESCEVLRSFPESGGSWRKCDGYQDTPLYVNQGDARMDVDAGFPDLDRLSPRGGAFNSVADTVEWRVRDGEPLAAIVRFDIETGTGESWSDLAVLKVGEIRSPGCLVAWVPAEAEPDQNTEARRIADEEAPPFTCDTAPEGPELPAGVLGRFAPTAEECALSVSVDEVIVDRNRLEFFYGYADIVSVVDNGSGRYAFETTLYQLEGAVEIIPERVTYRLRTTADTDTIQFGFVGGDGPQTLIRCS